MFLYHFLYSYIWNAQILDKFLAVYCSVYVSNQQVLECTHSRQVSCAILFMYVSNQQVFHLRQVELFCIVVNACDR